MKKKYSKDHMLMLVFIYYFKNLLSFSDIEELFRPITSKHFSGQTSQLSLEDIYNEVFTLEKGEMNNLKSDVAAKFARAQDTFSDAPVDDKDREYLKLFAFICELSFDVYLKTQMIEMIADQLREDAPAPPQEIGSITCQPRLDGQKMDCRGCRHTYRKQNGYRSNPAAISVF